MEHLNTSPQPSLYKGEGESSCSTRATLDSNVPRGTFEDFTGWNNSTKSEKLNNANVPHGTFPKLKNFFSVIIFIGLFQAIIGLMQFFSQSSTGLFWLKESLISPETLGVAKVVLNGEKVVRSYGLMPHPNILGGFLLFSIIVTFLYHKLFHPPIRRTRVEQFEEKNYKSSNQENVLRGTFLKNLYSKLNLNCSTWNILSNLEHKKWFQNFREKFNMSPKWLFTAIILIQLLALSLTFSKSAILGLILALMYIYSIIPTFKTKNCSTWNNSTKTENQSNLNIPNSSNKKMFHVEHSEENGIIWNFIKSHISKFQLKEKFKNLSQNFSESKKIILVTLIILVSFFIFAAPSTESLFTKSAQERISYLNVPRGTLQSDPILGIGAGQGVISMQKFFQKTLKPWEYQPIHNVFLIILAELGLVGLVLFIWWLWKLFHPATTSIVPPRKYFHCSTWNNENPRGKRGTISENKQKETGDSNIILSNIALYYFKGILLGFIFIMLFDHYFWDIQQGSVLLWMVSGFIVGINKK